VTKSCFKLNNFHKKCINSLKEIYIFKTSNSIKLERLASSIPIQIIVLCFMCKKEASTKKNQCLKKNQLFLKVKQPMCKHKVCIYEYKYTKMDMQFGKFNVDASPKMLCISFNTFSFQPPFWLLPHVQILNKNHNMSI
jgi:hypothetical protein